MTRDQRTDEDIRPNTDDITAADWTDRDERSKDGDLTEVRTDTEGTHEADVDEHADARHLAGGERGDGYPDSDTADYRAQDLNGTNGTRDDGFSRHPGDVTGADRAEGGWTGQTRDETGTDSTDTRTDAAELSGNGERASKYSAPQAAGDESPAELFAPEMIDRFRGEWQHIQGRFVDDPQDAVRGADHLVAEVMQALATMFSEHKHELESQWQQRSEAETEDLRLALRRYRSFFNQLLDK
jgi:hypothetical protein